MSWDLEVCRSLWGVVTDDALIPRHRKIRVGYVETTTGARPERKFAW